MQVAYRIILPFLAKQTKEKIHIVGHSHWKEKLLKHIEPSHLPVLWGGERVGENGEANANISLGGVV